MGLESVLEDSLARPESTDLIYLVLEDNRVSEMYRKDDYLTNPDPARLLGFLYSKVSKLGINVIRDHVVDAIMSRDGSIVVVSHGGRLLRSRFVVDASGPFAVVVKGLGIYPPRLPIMGMQLYLRVDDPVNETFFFYDKNGRFDHVGWIVPKDETLIVGVASTVIKNRLPRYKFIEDVTCVILKEYGYKCPSSLAGKRYLYGTVPVGPESFVFDVSLPGGGSVFAVGEAGGFITPRNGEGIPYALWTGTYAAMYLEDPEGYRRRVCRDIVLGDLLPKIRETRRFYKSIHGVDPLEYVRTRVGDSLARGGCSV